MLLVEMAGIFVSFRRVYPVESRVIGIRGARVHENWGRVQRATRETRNDPGVAAGLSPSLFLSVHVFALELDNHVEGGPSPPTRADDPDYRDHNQPITGTLPVEVSNVNSCGTRIDFFRSILGEGLISTRSMYSADNRF